MKHESANPKSSIQSRNVICNFRKSDISSSPIIQQNPDYQDAQPNNRLQLQMQIMKYRREHSNEMKLNRIKEQLGLQHPQTKTPNPNTHTASVISRNQFSNQRNSISFIRQTKDQIKNIHNGSYKVPQYHEMNKYFNLDYLASQPILSNNRENELSK